MKEIARRVATASADNPKRIILAAPTGAGKTRIMLELLNLPGKQHVYTDRRMLFSQLDDNMTQHGIHHGLIAAGSPPRISDKQLCMSQTVFARNIKKGRSLPTADTLIWDEVHKFGGESAMHIRDRYDASIDIGFTATPVGLGHCYDDLVVVAKNSELRDTGALVPAIHFAPDEPSLELITGKKQRVKDVTALDVGGGECAIPTQQRVKFAKVIFGSVLGNYLKLNPTRRPTILFAPGVAESIYFAKDLTSKGINTAHIDGKNVWLEGELIPKTQELVDEVRDMLKSGRVKIVSNRFVLREGIDWPFVSHGIFATVFGSITSYIQAGGRILRAYAGKEACTIQDHGGNWHRHGSLNEDRYWDLEYTDRIISQLRQDALRADRELEPITCFKCGACRRDGSKCHNCGHNSADRHRLVLQVDGSLKSVRGKIYKPRVRLTGSEKSEAEWQRRVKAARYSKRASMDTRTFAQLEVSFARDNNWKYPSRGLAGMPLDPIDFFRPVKDVPPERLRKKGTWR